MFRSVLRAKSFRSIHTVPRLSQDAAWSVSGIPNLYSAEGYRTAWKDYQKYLVTQLSLLTSGTDLETKTAFELVVITREQANYTNIFHYASQLHNNHFFFSTLTNPEENTSVPSRELSSKIDESFGNLESLKNEILRVAYNLNGNGWIYLVETIDKKLEIKILNNDGTPYFYNRNQSFSLNSPITLNEYSKLVQYRKHVKDKKQDYNLPLLGISVWDMSYNIDYGVNRKREYLEKVWKAVNWDVVSKRVFSLS